MTDWKQTACILCECNCGRLLVLTEMRRVVPMSNSVDTVLQG